MRTKLTRDGLTIFRRYSNPGAVWYTRMRVNGKIRTLSLAETAEKSFQIAVAARRSKREGKFDAFRAATLQRSAAAPSPTLGELLPWYRKYPGNIKPATKNRNIHALSALLSSVLGPPSSVNSVRLDQLTDDVLRRWQQTVKERAYAPDVDDERRAQILRSANSILAQARSIFARSRRNDFPDYYHHEASIELPPCIVGFRERPGFGGVQKTDYHAPPDSIVATTLAALEAVTTVTTVTTDDLNLYLACWLAIGFGLRASEISRALCGDFQLVGGDVFFRPFWRAKNNRVPEIGVQLDAWQRLEPHIITRPANEYVLRGKATERTTDVFRRISTWMKTLGWQTTHQIHELRAWAGCQIVAGRSGTDQNWEAARRFLRHSHVSTTQNYYGQHFRAKIEKVPLPLFHQAAA